MNTNQKVDVSVYQKAKKGNLCCGDSYFYAETDTEFICAIADGLGNGEFAKESSQIVVEIIEEYVEASVEQLVNICNKKLQGKRGAVLGILKINFKSQMYTFSSIGNIGVITIMNNKKKKRNIPNAGYLAGIKRTFKVEKGEIQPGMRFIMFSDGVSDKELSKDYFTNDDVHKVTDIFAQEGFDAIDDDTTLIVMRYDA
ncbi:protein phosphatase 2C domain-containing protein [Oceanobacillus chungangensis]|uniref:Indirect negative regulator of sigma-B activity n=1 Tax=Oceanobacillus chungangensis TaxID=1229152 RepID=A0A3D8PIP8_9BACI|nr:protein phosphatase 2C domain-containing protein [Oceanobacillus chungangensis]RDW15098.1 indirect negative regulator of sigma-B activity [Oceanobacillus chungangensis]